MEYREFPPPASFARMVRCCWTLEGDASDGSADPVFPDGSPEIICNVGDPIHARQPSGIVEAQPPLMLVGQITSPFIVQPTGVVKLFGIRLEPFGGSAFSENMSSITDSWVDLTRTSTGGTGTPERRDPIRTIAREVSLSSVGELLWNALQSSFARSDVPHPAVVNACRTIREARGNVSLEELADGLDISTRSLQRRFALEVGIPPKLLARITRFQHVFSAWRKDPRTLAAVAADCGYFDQSHLVRDFRDFAGEAPAAALAEQATFTAFFLP